MLKRFSSSKFPEYCPDLENNSHRRVRDDGLGMKDDGLLLLREGERREGCCGMMSDVEKLGGPVRVGEGW